MVRLRRYLVASAALAAGACVSDFGPPQVGEPIAAFEASRIGTDEPVSLASLRGSPFVLNVWATWCAPCRHETPLLQSIYARYQEDGLKMVGISVDTRSAMPLAREFLAEHRVTYIQLHDPEMRSMDVFQILGLPATYIVDAEGIVRLTRPGPVVEGDTQFIEMIETLVDETR